VEENAFRSTYEERELREALSLRLSEKRIYYSLPKVIEKRFIA
jgi:hypothetical protein